VIEKQIVYERWLSDLFAEARDSARGLNIEAGFSALARGSAAVAGERIGLEVRLPDGGHLMILNYTSDGTINVIYPYTDAETRSVATNSKISFTDLMEVTKPYGRDFVLLVALDTANDTYNSLATNHQFSYNSTMGDRLRAFLTDRESAKGVAELTLLTSARSTK
jgi:hypothetical protein